MRTPSSPTARPRPVERFKPTSGIFLGWAGLVCAAVAVAWTAYAVHTVAGLRVALGAVFFAIVVWVTQLRPRATAYPRDLVLQNSLRDTTIPLRAVEDVAVGQSLVVFAGDKRHVCIGIGNSLRADMRERRRKRPQTLLGENRWREFADRADRAAPDQTAMSYQTFVVTRIEELAENARKERRPEGEADERVRHSWAWPEVVGLLATAVAFGATFLV